MAQTIKLRRSATPGNEPTTGELNLGELAINTNDGRLFTLKSVSGSLSVVEFLNVASATDLYVDVAGDIMTGTLSMSAQILGFFGSDGAPGYSFTGDPDSGMFLTTFGLLSFSASGAEALRLTAQQTLIGQGGTISLPGLAFIGDENTGIYQNSVGELRFTNDGIEHLRLGGSQVLISINGCAGRPGLAFASDVDVGMYREAAGILGFSANGSNMLRLERKIPPAAGSR